MAYPTIVFNASTGSDTAASGAGPATAVTGTGASLNATTAVDLSADSPDLSGVATDGSACLWVQTSSGRQFSKITAVDNSTKVVTVETAYTVTESSRTWAIGGKRATLDNASSRLLFSADSLAGWTIETETDQTITTTALTVGVSGNTTSGYITFRGSDPVSKKTLVQSSNATNLDLGTANNFWRIQHLKFTNSNATKTLAVGLRTTVTGHIVENCIFGDITDSLGTGLQRNANSTSILLKNCEICYCTSVGINWHNWTDALVLNCYIHHNQTGLIGSPSLGLMENCIVADNTTNGWEQVAAANSLYRMEIKNCTWHNNGSNGIHFNSSVVALLSVFNCNFTENGGYGIRAFSVGQKLFADMIDFNNFGTGATANASGARLNLDAGLNDLEVDPEYTDAANGDYSIGTNLKAKGFPKSTSPIGIGSATYSFTDIGAAQRQESAAGGGVRIPNIRGGADQ